jgi:hypothetical protein
MSSKYKLYRPVVMAAIAVGIGIATIAAIAFLKEPIASAGNAVRSIPQNSEAVITAQHLAQASAPETLEATVYRDPNCGCCDAWVEHLRSNGFQVSVVQEPNMNAVKQEYSVPDDLVSCHTAIINGAVIEGHVPSDDIKRFLSEESDAVGLAVPGMPIGSPGMESGDVQEPFTVFSFDQQGNTEAFNQYLS